MVHNDVAYGTLRYLKPTLARTVRPAAAGRHTHSFITATAQTKEEKKERKIGESEKRETKRIVLMRA